MSKNLIDATMPIPVGDDHEEDINVDDLQVRLQPEEPRSSGGSGAAAVNASSSAVGHNNLSRPNLTGGTHSLESVFGSVWRIQSGAVYHSLGFEDEDLGSSPGWWAATAATY